MWRGETSARQLRAEVSTMKVALNLLMIAVVAACGQTSASPSPAQATPSPEKFGVATLSETKCSFEMPDSLPLHEVSFSLVNKTKYTGRFIFSNIHDGHTFKDLIDYWNSPMGQVERPSFITEIGLTDVPTNTSSEMVAPVAVAGTYAFNCGYLGETGTVTGFFHELRAG
jgi:hypothetical protein